jgi:ferredoxin/flavodoxin
MTNTLKKAAIVYCSPNGSTRHVAGVIEENLMAQGMTVSIAELGKSDEDTLIIKELHKEKTCLFIGSPVYVNRALPPVMDFISQLPENTDMPVVPFVTWGCVTSGIALYDMGKALSEKGFRIMGAAKVPALHSMFWHSENPLGQGRPNPEDDAHLRELVNIVLKKLSGTSGQIHFSVLADQPAEIQAQMEKMSLEIAKAHMPPKKIDEKKCTQCQLCVEACPVRAVRMTPYPEFSSHCIFCFNCVKACPENAITTDMGPVEERIRGRAAQLNEQNQTKIFV